MRFAIPQACSIDKNRLAVIAGTPLVAAITMASVVAATGILTDPISEAGGPLRFLLEFVTLSYLAVSVAHVSGAMIDRTIPHFSGPLNWSDFPNHLDGAAIAGAIALLSLIIASGFI